MSKPNSGMSCALGCWAMAAAVALVTLIMLLVLGNWGLIAALFMAGLAFVVLGILFSFLFCRELPPLGGAADDSAAESANEAAASAAAATKPAAAALRQQLRRLRQRPSPNRPPSQRRNRLQNPHARRTKTGSSPISTGCMTGR
jgi:hypothetical protein